MNGIHDMGGMQGFGPVLPTFEYTPYHAAWERTVLGITFSALSDGYFNSDDIRRATETIPAGQYLNMSYFERWLASTQALLIEKNVISHEELVAGHPDAGFVPKMPPVTGEVAIQVLEIGASTRVSEGVAPRFAVGEQVRVLNIQPEHHTRLPRYVRGHVGVVMADNGIFSLPDSNSRGLGPDPQHVYSVRFLASTLWGCDASVKDTVQLELFDSYLEAME